MNIQENKLLVERTGVFYTAGDLVNAPVNWFTCHGYGQLAETHIKKFNEFVSKGHSVISVEGMNRFYWQGVSGRLAATWMTSRFRLDEIRDNNTFLSSIYNTHYNKERNILLGFSQGGTTIWRWIHERRPDFDVFINYAGWMPEDIDLSVLGDYLVDKKLIFTYGVKDQYLTEDRISAFKDVVTKSKLNIIIHKTEGDHRIDREVLNEIYSLYIDR